MACQITFNQILRFLPANELSMKDVGMVVISMIVVKNTLFQNNKIQSVILIYAHFKIINRCNIT